MTYKKPNPSPLSEQGLAEIIQGMQLQSGEAVVRGSAICDSQGFLLNTPEVFMLQENSQCSAEVMTVNCDKMKTQTPDELKAFNHQLMGDMLTSEIANAKGSAAFITNVEDACHIELPQGCTAKDKQAGKCFTQ